MFIQKQSHHFKGILNLTDDALFLNLMSSPCCVFFSVLSLYDLPILNVNIPFCGASVIRLYTQRITELAVERKKLATGD